MVNLGTSGKNANHNITINGVTAFKVLTSTAYKLKNTKVHFDIIDNSYFMYEKGYLETHSRCVKFKDGKATFKFDGFVYDLTETFDFSDEFNELKNKG